jgi:hypothetical protein
MDFGPRFISLRSIIASELEAELLLHELLEKKDPKSAPAGIL